MNTEITINVTMEQFKLLLEALTNEEEAARGGMADDPGNEANAKYQKDLAELLANLTDEDA